jgi:hypothetical protein
MWQPRKERARSRRRRASGPRRAQGSTSADAAGGKQRRARNCGCGAPALRLIAARVCGKMRAGAGAMMNESYPPRELRGTR